ncbi:hypothetical protein [Nocardia sp. IFM 10818]
MLTIDVAAADGSWAQTITEENVDIDFSQPSLLDTDDDGREELLVPLILGPYWARTAVYHATGTTGEFVRAGEFTGLGIESAGDGYTVTDGKLPGYQGYFYSFWIYEDDQLVPIATAEVHVTPDSTGTAVAGTECVLTDDGGLYRTGMTFTEARRYFCAQPAVTATHR